MGANITVYCLENLTDYLEFERLCHDLMSLQGYPSIEPLGGFSDKGRDAIHVDNSDQTTIFAYSVREDWRVKLAEDASKVHKHGHDCDQLVFITTARFTAGERDEAIGYIRDDYGWELELFGVERLRILLDVQHPQVKALHPHIFPPEFLAQTKIGTSIEQNHLFISFSPEDSALADWLTRKLTAEGYLVWCERFSLLGGETYPEDVDNAIRAQTFRVLGLYSQASLQNPEVMRQRALALSIRSEENRDFLIPLDVDGVSRDQLDRVTGSLTFISFADWASGLGQLLRKLESIGCPKSLPNGRAIAVQALLEKDVIADQSETLYSNCLLVERIPDVIHRFRPRRGIPYAEITDLGRQWAFRKVNPRLLLSFHQPPPATREQYQLKAVGDRRWREVGGIDGVSSPNLVSELLRKSLLVRCHEKGLQHCPSTGLCYFPAGLVEGDRLKYTRPDGTKTYVSAVGQRKFWRPSESEEYRYYLAPNFYVVQDLFDDFTVLVRIRIRLSDIAGTALPKRKANSRRKHLCHDWWNKEWLNRMLAVCQYLADDELIIIGQKAEERVIVNAVPVHVNAPIGINEEVLDQLSYERLELLRDRDKDEPDEQISES